MLHSAEAVEVSSVGIMAVDDGVAGSELCMSDRLIFRIYDAIAIRGQYMVMGTKITWKMK